MFDLSTCRHSRELPHKTKVTGVAIPAAADKALFSQRPAVALCVTPETVPMPDKALAFDLH